MATRFAELNTKIDTLSEQVNTDSLTQLYNRRHLDSALEQEMERSRRSHQATSVAIIDADYFKKINDEHGHLIGDKVLIHIASIIKNAIRKIDIACRYGGEEFALILPSTPLMFAAQVAERIRKAIAESKVEFDDTRINVTVSIGLTVFDNVHEDSAEQILARADAELYKAKDLGRNQLSFQAETKASTAEVSQDEKDALFGGSEQGSENHS